MIIILQLPCCLPNSVWEIRRKHLWLQILNFKIHHNPIIKIPKYCKKNENIKPTDITYIWLLQMIPKQDMKGMCTSHHKLLILFSTTFRNMFTVLDIQCHFHLTHCWSWSLFVLFENVYWYLLVSHTVLLQQFSFVDECQRTLAQVSSSTSNTECKVYSNENDCPSCDFSSLVITISCPCNITAVNEYLTQPLIDKNLNTRKDNHGFDVSNLFIQSSSLKILGKTGNVFQIEKKERKKAKGTKNKKNSTTSYVIQDAIIYLFLDIPHTGLQPHESFTLIHNEIKFVY